MPRIPKGYYIGKEEDIPIEYRDAVEKAVAEYEHEAFYTGSEEAGYILRPEFIRGVYNSESHSFIENENYYGNLTPEDRDKLFDEDKW